MILAWQSFYTDNLIAVIILGIFLFIGLYILKHPFWGSRIKNSFRSLTAKFGLGLAILFFGLAWLDSISWRDNISSEKNKDGLIATKPRTILDRSFSTLIGMKEYQYKEKTLSAPLAETEFYDKENKLKNKHLKVRKNGPNRAVFHFLP